MYWKHNNFEFETTLKCPECESNSVVKIDLLDVSSSPPITVEVAYRCMDCGFKSHDFRDFRKFQKG